jgi:uroporphyrinogen decarboxylase
VADYLNAQIAAGAQAVMIFDSWGGVLADGAFQDYSLAYTERVLAKLWREHDGKVIPRIVFTKGGGLWLSEMARIDCEVLGLDWTMGLGQARALVGEHKALQGNLDPQVLFAPPAQVRHEARRLLESFGTPHNGTGTGPSHIFNLGHGINQHTPPDHVQALVDEVHAHSRRMRKLSPSA